MPRKKTYFNLNTDIVNNKARLIRHLTNGKGYEPDADAIFFNENMSKCSDEDKDKIIEVITTLCNFWWERITDTPHARISAYIAMKLSLDDARKILENGGEAGSEIWRLRRDSRAVADTKLFNDICKLLDISLHWLLGLGEIPFLFDDGKTEYAYGLYKMLGENNRKFIKTLIKRKVAAYEG